MKTKHTITLTTKELETLIFHLDVDLNQFGAEGSWGNGDGFLNDSLQTTKDPNRRTQRGTTILRKLESAL